MRTRRSVGALLLIGSTACVHAPATRAPVHAAPAPVADRASVVHLLQRFTFGIRPGDVERVQRTGLDAWLEAQLASAPDDDPEVAAALAPYADALRSPDQLYAGYALREDDRTLASAGTDPMLPGSAALAIDATRALDSAATTRALSAARMREGCRTASGSIDAMCIQRARQLDDQELRGRLQMTALVRHVTSERQVQEVLTDFWTNHFNVYFAKGPDRWLTGDFVEHVIRPHALGRFEDLLLAVAHHPAMLVYLDNWRSVAQRDALPGQPARGLNENYARELLELHTLGIEGGYTQHDVVDVARVLTGWSITPPASGLFAFQFRSWLHDRDRKTVLGQVFEPGGGEEEGIALLRMLARHPATAHFIARALCTRFVADDPPPALVDAIARVYQQSGGDVRAMVRAIAHAPAFDDPAQRDGEVRTPLEFLTAAMRALGARFDGTDRATAVLARLGQPLFMNPVPTGYSDRAEAWAGSSAMLDRMNLALSIASDRVPGLSVDLDATSIESTTDTTRQVDEVDRVVLSGRATTATRAALVRAIAGIADGQRARAMAVGLALGSPVFQRQ